MNREINHIKAHPDVYIGLCGVREENSGANVGFVMDSIGRARCPDCVAKYNDPKYQARRLARIRTMSAKNRIERRLRPTIKSFRIGEGAYSQ